MKSAVVAGHICLDIIPEVGHHFDLIPGRLYEVGAATLCTGGAVSNTGITLSILGVPTRLAGKIGDDTFGRAVTGVLERFGRGLSKSMIVDPQAVTSYTVVINIPGVDRIFLHCPGANHAFGEADIEPASFGDAALFHFGYPTLMGQTYAEDGRQREGIFRKVKQAGLTTSLDMTMPDPNGPSGRANWEAILRRTLPHTDVFLPSADELLYMIDRSRFGQGDNLSGDALTQIGARLLSMGAAVAGVKLGSRGLYLRTGPAERIRRMGRAAPADVEAWANRELWFPVYQIPHVAGTTGAGDATIAGFFAALLRGGGVEACGNSANAFGACNVQAPDALSGIKSWDETQALLARGWPRGPLDVQGAGWRHDAKTGIWHGPAEG